MLDTSTLDNLMLEDSHYEEALGYRYMRNLLTTLPAGSRSIYLVMTQLSKALGTPYNDVIGKQVAKAGIMRDELKKLQEAEDKRPLPADSATGFDVDDDEEDTGKRHIYNEKYVTRRRTLPANVAAQIEDDRKELIAWLDKKIAKTDDIEPSIVIRNLRLLAKELNLTPEETQVLELSYVTHSAGEFAMVATTLADQTISKAKFLSAAFLGMSQTQYAKILDTKGRIRSMYLVREEDSFDEDVDMSQPFTRLEEGTYEMLSSPEDLTSERIKTFFCGDLLGSKLKIEDFRSVIPNIDKVVEMIRNAIENKEQGVSVLLYGPAGTGKTSLAKAIAAEIGIELYGSGMSGEGTEIERDRDGSLSEELSSGLNRMRKLRRTLLMLKEQGNVAVLTDEFVDLFARGTDGKSKPTSKLLMQDLIETNTIPVFYTTNETGEMPDSVLDRMIPIYVGVSPTLVRARIWNNILTEQKFSLPETDILQLAREFAAPPRVISFAVREARLKAGDIDTIRQSIRDKALLRMNDERGFDVMNPLHEKFSTDFITASTGDQAQMQGMIDTYRASTKRWSILIHGPESSGKTSMGRYVLEQMHRNHIELDMRDFKDNIYQILEIMPKALTITRSNNDVLMLQHIEVLQEAKDVWPKIVKMLMQHPCPLLLTAGDGVDMKDAALNMLVTKKWKTASLDDSKVTGALKHFFTQTAGVANDNELEEAVTALQTKGGARIGDFALAATFGQWQEVAALPDITRLVAQSREVAQLGRSSTSVLGFGANR